MRKSDRHSVTIADHEIAPASQFSAHSSRGLNRSHAELPGIRTPTGGSAKSIHWLHNILHRLVLSEELFGRAAATFRGVRQEPPLQDRQRFRRMPIYLHDQVTGLLRICATAAMGLGRGKIVSYWSSASRISSTRQEPGESQKRS